jgi:hypothetical protein
VQSFTLIIRPSAYRILSVGRTAAALDLVGRNGGHLVTCNRIVDWQ